MNKNKTILIDINSNKLDKIRLKWEKICIKKCKEKEKKIRLKKQTDYLFKYLLNNFDNINIKSSNNNITKYKNLNNNDLNILFDNLNITNNNPNINLNNLFNNLNINN